jgi:hypothetical protein
LPFPFTVSYGFTACTFTLAIARHAILAIELPQQLLPSFGATASAYFDP